MIKFGTGGWRAFITGEEFTRGEKVRLVASAGKHHQQWRCQLKTDLWSVMTVVFLSDKAACWFAEVLAANNIKVSFIDKFVPTPIVMFQAKEMGCTYRHVLPLHNPADYNGIKVFIEGGRDADEIITEVEDNGTANRNLTNEDVIRVDLNKRWTTKRSKSSTQWTTLLIRSLTSSISSRSRKRTLRVPIDPMFGVAKNALQTVLINGRWCRRSTMVKTQTSAVWCFTERKQHCIAWSTWLRLKSWHRCWYRWRCWPPRYHRWER